MSVPSHEHAIRLVISKFSQLLEIPRELINTEVTHPNGRYDAVIRTEAYTFVVEYKGSGATASVASAIEQLGRAPASYGNSVIPVVVVPYMGEVGQRRCAEVGFGWMDLSGNAHIFAPGLRIHIEGRPNKYKRRGRPSSAFAPKSSRIARRLLMNPRTPLSQRELARATDVDEGFTSRIVAKLEQDGLVVRETNGSILAADPVLLLDAWYEEYDFSKHHLIEGHVSARSGEALARKLSGWLNDSGEKFAATGLAGAWLLNHFAAFRIATFYLDRYPQDWLLDAFGFQPEPRGANVWLVVPADGGVLSGREELDGIPCVHPVQVYLDLKGHPERATEAAAALKADLVKGWQESHD